jgi:hypothetical protein
VLGHRRRKLGAVALLRFGLRTVSRRLALIGAWALSGVLLGVAIAGLMTFLLGLFVIPGAAALVAAVGFAMPRAVSESPIRRVA